MKNDNEYRQALNDNAVRVVLVQADNAGVIAGAPIGLAINICSMQEMDPAIISDYFNFIRRSGNNATYFYCVNRIEKRLPDGTIVSFFKYPWDEKDKILVDELCPWQQKYYSLTPPFYRPYDGPIQHRLVLMNKKIGSINV